MTQALKTHPEYFKAIESGEKTFDIRKDDRGYKVGQTLLLQEFDPEKQQYTGKELNYIITYILRDVPKFGLKPGFCILSIKEKEN